MSIEKLTNQAEIIFEGECVSKRSGKDPETGFLSTWYTFKVTRGIKGVGDEEITVKQYGGTDGEITVDSLTAQYTVGEEIVLFLYGESKIGYTSAVGLQQGKFTIKKIPESDKKYVTNGLPAKFLFEDMKKETAVISPHGSVLHGQEKLLADRLDKDGFTSLLISLVKEEQEKEK